MLCHLGAANGGESGVWDDWSMTTQPRGRVDPVGQGIPSLSFPASDGGVVDLGAGTPTNYVLFVYPRTSRPNEPESTDWAMIPGAKGCTAESCEFRDLAMDYASLGYSIYGLSTQDSAYQHKAVERLHLPYLLLSDAELALGRELGLEHFLYNGALLYKRCTLVVRAGVITETYLDIADPASHPRDLLTNLDHAR